MNKMASSDRKIKRGPPANQVKPANKGGVQKKSNKRKHPYKRPDRDGDLPMTSTSTENRQTAQINADTVRKVLKEFIIRRHNKQEKFLDLSALSSDSELQRLEFFNGTEERASKVFGAIMVNCEQIWPKYEERRENVQSISLARNNIKSVKDVSRMANTFAKIRNIDLSDNQLADLKSLEPWSQRFNQLDHLIIRGNGIETDQEFQPTIMKWYRKLRAIDGVQVRTDDQVPQRLNIIPIAVPLQEGHVQIAQEFLLQYIPSFDNNRTETVQRFYSPYSTFSLNVKNNAATDHKKSSWGKWIGLSRNLKKITTLNARDKRLKIGQKDIDKLFSEMPKTRHPDIINENDKYLMECQSVTGLPDATGKSPYGLNGMIINLHGEFTESEGEQPQRSFTRTFVLADGEEPGTIKILREVLDLRPYTGTGRFRPTLPLQSSPTPIAGLAVPMEGGVHPAEENEVL